MFYDLYTPKNIIGVEVFLESKITRKSIGVLTRTITQAYVFQYDITYLKSKKPLQLGPELPTTKRYFTSKELFPSFQDRIPSLQNPAYIDYCHSVGIDAYEKDKLILLATIAKKGPSSFIFEPIYKGLDCRRAKKFRQDLALTTREFAALLGVTQSTIIRLESGRSSRREINKLIEYTAVSPELLKILLKKNGKHLHHRKQVDLLSRIQANQFEQ